MQILYVSTLYPPSIGGAQLQLHCLAKAMQAAGDSVSVLTLSDRNRTDWLRLATVSPEAPAAYEFEGIRVQRLGRDAATRRRMLPWALGYYAMIRPATRALAALTLPQLEAAAPGTPDLVHCSRIGREFIAQAALDYARRRDIPYVLTPNHHPRWRGWRYAAYDDLYRAADAQIVYTEAEKATLVNDLGIDADRVYVTGVGPLVSETYDIEAFRRKHGITRDFVLFLGQQYPYKGIDALLAAAERVWPKHPNIEFVFIGPPTPWSEERFNRVADPRIHNLGRVDADEKAAALAACRFLCMPSNQESFGGVYIEAWCYGKAAIGGDIPAIRCVIDDGVNGFVSPQEPAPLAEKILRLLDEPALAERMGAAGKEKVRAEYSWEKLAEKTRAAYLNILKRG